MSAIAEKGRGQNLSVKDVLPSLPPEDETKWEKYIKTAITCFGQPKTLTSIGRKQGIRVKLTNEAFEKVTFDTTLEFYPTKGKIRFDNGRTEKDGHEDFILSNIESVETKTDREGETLQIWMSEKSPFQLVEILSDGDYRFLVQGDYKLAKKFQAQEVGSWRDLRFRDFSCNNVPFASGIVE